VDPNDPLNEVITDIKLAPRNARGIDTVVVNGEVVWRAGKPSGARPGRILERR
jgi:N-acyl-D-amino-acid deacylase